MPKSEQGQRRPIRGREKPARLGGDDRARLTAHRPSPQAAVALASKIGLHAEADDRRKRRAGARGLFGRIKWEGDLHRERVDEPEESDHRA
jgi:hypothetical protein